jgi:hypothetical protein
MKNIDRLARPGFEGQVMKSDSIAIEQRAALCGLSLANRKRHVRVAPTNVVAIVFGESPEAERGHDLVEKDRGPCKIVNRHIDMLEAEHFNRFHRETSENEKGAPTDCRRASENKTVVTKRPRPPIAPTRHS